MAARHAPWLQLQVRGEGGGGPWIDEVGGDRDGVDRMTREWYGMLACTNANEVGGPFSVN